MADEKCNCLPEQENMSALILYEINQRDNDANNDNDLTQGARRDSTCQSASQCPTHKRANGHDPHDRPYDLA